ncbi:hypothetical protein F5Y16DRAFT_422012 [Xylariaceae sp. FL0255]|nr:hypothetical protein F5Y16DRAFT_422012 [Xylariaceae sp. FL0255]
MESKTSKYEAVPLTDDQEKLLPKTQFPRSFTEDWRTTESRSEERTARRNLSSSLKSYLWFIDTALLLVISGLLLLLVIKDHSKQPSTWQVGGDYSGTGPDFSTRVVKWEADMTFVPSNTTEFFSDETLDRWKTLMPAGTGFGEPGKPFSTTSMTHQLHCLFMMGRIYAGVTTNITDSLPWDYHNHFLHCIDYLRQAVMCAGDLALELHDPSTDPDDLGPKDGGWNGHHVCKDYSQILGYLEHQISDGSRIVLPIDD